MICEQLKDQYLYCFAEPTLSITMYDAKTGSSDQSRVITCTVQHSAGEPTMNMFYVKPGGSMMHLKGAKSTLLAGASTTATLYGRVSDMDPSEGVILCNATDLRGNYSVEKRRGNEGKRQDEKLLTPFTNMY